MKHLIQNKYWEIAKEYNKEKLLYLLIDRPTEIDSFGNFIWENNKNLWHRDYNLPSFINNIGDIWWYENGKLNRKNKPSMILNKK